MRPRGEKNADHADVNTKSSFAREDRRTGIIYLTKPRIVEQAAGGSSIERQKHPAPNPFLRRVT